MTLLAYLRKSLALHAKEANLCLAGWCDAAHRDLLARYGGTATADNPLRVSAMTMSAVQLKAVIASYQYRGVVVGKSKSLDNGITAVSALSKSNKLVLSLWSALHKAGKINSGSRAALFAWIRRQGVNATCFEQISTPQNVQLINALKAYAAR